MKKKLYISPRSNIVALKSSHAFLLSGSLNGTTVIEDGGSAEQHEITSADVKEQEQYNVWDDDWSEDNNNN